MQCDKRAEITKGKHNQNVIYLTDSDSFEYNYVMLIKIVSAGRNPALGVVSGCISFARELGTVDSTSRHTPAV
jgi:hypothetical protein